MTVVPLSIQLLDMVRILAQNHIRFCRVVKIFFLSHLYKTGRTDVVEWLIQNKHPIDDIINKRDNYGNIPLHYAITGSKKKFYLKF